MVGQGPGAVDMAGLQMLEEGIAAIEADSRCLGEAASKEVARQAGGRHGDCSGRGQELVQAQIGIWITLDDTVAVAAVVAIAVAEACSSGLQAAIADGMTGWEVDVDAAGKAFDMRKPCWDCRALAGCSTMSFGSGFALDPLPEWKSVSMRVL